MDRKKKKKLIRWIHRRKNGDIEYVEDTPVIHQPHESDKEQNRSTWNEK